MPNPTQADRLTALLTPNWVESLRLLPDAELPRWQACAVAFRADPTFDPTDPGMPVQPCGPAFELLLPRVRDAWAFPNPEADPTEEEDRGGRGAG